MAINSTTTDVIYADTNVNNDFNISCSTFSPVPYLITLLVIPYTEKNCIIKKTVNSIINASL